MENEIIRMENEQAEVDTANKDGEKSEKERYENFRFSMIKCRYYNKGFCKYRQKCRCSHPTNI
jgi:hypothetical protein